ncbi:MAG: 6-bladed beta-propeller [Salinivirgaceae bacterium]|nr:6-bladed beta-propeller [Salinivirgaceae bacterium]
MNHKLFFLGFVAMVAVTNCFGRGDEAQRKITLPGKISGSEFANAVESVSVFDLKLDDDKNHFLYTYLVCVSDNYIFYLNNWDQTLMCYDKHSGEKVSIRSLRGRSGAELLGAESMYCVDDTICIFEQNGGFIKKYDCHCKYVSTVNKTAFSGEDVEPLGNKGYAVVSDGGFPISEDMKKWENKYVSIYDSKFKLVSRYFEIPSVHYGQTKYYGDRCLYTIGDTLRFAYSLGTKLYSYCNGKAVCSYEFLLPNPLPDSYIKNDSKQLWDGEKKGYGGFLTNWGETSRFIEFTYTCGGKRYMTLLDKRTNKTFTVKELGYPEQIKPEESWNFCFGNAITHLLFADGEYLYFDCTTMLYNYLCRYEKNLDGKIKALLADFKKTIERNKEYLDGLDPDEATNHTHFILKVKLKN